MFFYIYLKFPTKFYTRFINSKTIERMVIFFTPSHRSLKMQSGNISERCYSALTDPNKCNKIYFLCLKFYSGFGVNLGK